MLDTASQQVSAAEWAGSEPTHLFLSWHCAARTPRLDRRIGCGSPRPTCRAGSRCCVAQYTVAATHVDESSRAAETLAGRGQARRGAPMVARRDCTGRMGVMGSSRRRQLWSARAPPDNTATHAGEAARATETLVGRNQAYPSALLNAREGSTGRSDSRTLVGDRQLQSAPDWPI